MPTLLYHTGALGDFITTIPALRFWKAQHPDGRLILLGKPSIGALAKESGLIEGFLNVDEARCSPLFSGNASKEAAALLEPFTSAILLAAPGSPVADHARRCGLHPVWLQPPFPEESMHVVDYHLSLFTDSNSLSDEERLPKISPSSDSLAAVKALTSIDVPPVALHPGSGSNKKNWPVYRFFSVADAIRKKGFRVVWILGPAEEGLSVPSQDFTFAHQPFPLLAALLSGCRSFIGNDSGVAHLAAAVGCDTIVIFGASDPRVWAPRGRRVQILYKNEPCLPCHRTASAAGSCKKICLTEITVEDALVALRI